MYRNYTAEEWLDQVIDWSESDGAFVDPDEAEDPLETEDGYREYWESIIKENPQEFIDYISDGWELDFVEDGIDGHNYKEEFTEYAAYFNGEWLGDFKTLPEAEDAVRDEIGMHSPDDVNLDECYVEQFIDNDFSTYDADPIAWKASEVYSKLGE